MTSRPVDSKLKKKKRPELKGSEIEDKNWDEIVSVEMICYTALDYFTKNSSVNSCCSSTRGKSAKKLHQTHCYQVSISIGSIPEIAIITMCLSIGRGCHSNGTLLAVLWASNARVVEARQAFLRLGDR